MIEIFTGESAHFQGTPVHHAVLQFIRNRRIAARVHVYLGIAGAYEGGEFATVNILDLSANLPVKVEIILPATEADQLLPQLAELVTEGLITVRPLDVRYHRSEGKLLPKDLRVADVMTAYPTSVTPDTPALQVVQILMSALFRGLPVVDAGGRVVGIITEEDLVTRGRLPVRPGLLGRLESRADSSGAELSHLAALSTADLMSAPTETINADAFVLAAIRRLVATHHRSLPVVDATGRLVGMCSRLDLVRAAESGNRPHGGAPSERGPGRRQQRSVCGLSLPPRVAASHLRTRPAERYAAESMKHESRPRVAIPVACFHLLPVQGPGQVDRCPHQALHIPIRRGPEDLPGRTGLDDATVHQNRNPVGQGRNLTEVVRHKQGGHPAVPQHSPQVLEDRGPGQHVQGGEGLIQEEHPRLQRQRPGQADPLRLAPRERPGMPPGQVGHAEPLQRLGDPLADLRLGDVPEAQAQCHVVGHRAVDQQGPLEHHRHLPAQGKRLLRQLDGPTGETVGHLGGNQQGQSLEERRLPGTVGADYAQHFALLHGEGRHIDDQPAAPVDPQVFSGKHRRRHAARPRC